MKINLYTILLLILVSGFYSCEDNYILENDPAPKLVIQGEVLAGREIKVYINTSLDNNGKGNFEQPQDANCTVESEDGKIFRLFFKAEENAYFYGFDEDPENKPKAGEEYTIKVDLPNSNTKAIVATTTVPQAINSYSSTQEVSKIKVDNDSYKVQINNQFDFSDIEIDAEYIKLTVALEFKVVRDDGTLGIRKMDYKMNYSNSKSSDNVSTCEQVRAAYFDIRNDKSIDLVFTSSKAIPNNHILTNMYCEFSTISEEIFKYDHSISNSIQAQGSAYSEPVVSYTNISKGGIGVFGSSNMFSDTISLN